MHRVGLVVVALLFALPAARADDVAKAREHYKNATRAYELGSYDEAIREYAETYRLKDDPAILYNMAQANRLAEHNVEALRLYRMYLIKVPDAQNRAEVAEKIEALQKLVDQQKKAKSLPPDTTLNTAPRTPRSEREQMPPSPAPQATHVPPPAPASIAVDQHAGRNKKIAGLAIGVVGVAALGAGIAMSVLAKQASDDLTVANQNGQPFDRSLYDTGKAENLAGPILMAVGGAAVVAGVVVGVLGLRESRASKVAFAPYVDGSSAGAVLEVHR